MIRRNAIGSSETGRLPVEFSIPLGTAFDDLTDPVTFRIYVYAPSAGNSLEFDDVTLNGTVAAVPEPGAALLGGLGSLLLLVRRRR